MSVNTQISPETQALTNENPSFVNLRVNHSPDQIASTFYVKDRSTTAIVLGLYAADQKRLDAQSIEITNPTIKIEAGQTLLITPGQTKSETWRNGFNAKTLVPDAIEIEPYVGRAGAMRETG
jgi:hypothetical protein